MYRLGIPSALSEINPWWTLPRNYSEGDVKDLIRNDRELSMFVESRFRVRRSLFYLLFRDVDGRKAIQLKVIYSLRGPRQVGKTTLLKLLILKLLGVSLDGGIKVSRRDAIARPIEVIYINFDVLGMDDAKAFLSLMYELLRTRRYVREAKHLYIFLDEVTSIMDWTKSVKGLVDKGILKNSTIFVTGSHSLDVEVLSERLGGRRGETWLVEDAIPTGPDLELLPLTFRAFAEELLSKFREWKKETRVGGRSLAGVQGRAELLKALVLEGRVPEALYRLHEAFGDDLRKLFADYLLCGGIPRAVEAYLRMGKIPATIYKEYVDLTVGDATKWLGPDSNDVLRRLMKVLTEIISTAKGKPRLFGEASVDRGRGEKYLAFLERAYVTLSVRSMRVDTLTPVIVGAPMKRYFIDPFIYYAFYAWSRSLPDPFMTAKMTVEDSALVGRVVENTVARHMVELARSFSPSPMFNYQDHVFYARTNGEADFIVRIVPTRRSVGKALERELYVPIEVKHSEKPTKEVGPINNVAASISRNVGYEVHPIILTKDTLRETGNSVAIPIHEFLAIF